MRRFIALFALTLLVATLAGCGNKTDLVMPPPQPNQPKHDVPAAPSTAGLNHTLGGEPLSH
jgi:predicted small lipoprotein YifL